MSNPLNVENALPGVDVARDYKARFPLEIFEQIFAQDPLVDPPFSILQSKSKSDGSLDEAATCKEVRKWLDSTLLLDRTPYPPPNVELPVDKKPAVGVMDFATGIPFSAIHQLVSFVVEDTLKKPTDAKRCQGIHIYVLRDGTVVIIDKGREHKQTASKETPHPMAISTSILNWFMRQDAPYFLAKLVFTPNEMVDLEDAAAGAGVGITKHLETLLSLPAQETAWTHRAIAQKLANLKKILDFFNSLQAGEVMKVCGKGIRCGDDWLWERYQMILLAFVRCKSTCKTTTGPKKKSRASKSGGEQVPLITAASTKTRQAAVLPYNLSIVGTPTSSTQIRSPYAFPDSPSSETVSNEGLAMSPTDSEQEELSESQTDTIISGHGGYKRPRQEEFADSPAPKRARTNASAECADYTQQDDQNAQILSSSAPTQMDWSSTQSEIHIAADSDYQRSQMSIQQSPFPTSGFAHAPLNITQIVTSPTDLDELCQSILAYESSQNAQPQHVVHCFAVAGAFPGQVSPTADSVDADAQDFQKIQQQPYEARLHHGGVFSGALAYCADVHPAELQIPFDPTRFEDLFLNIDDDDINDDVWCRPEAMVELSPTI